MIRECFLVDYWKKVKERIYAKCINFGTRFQKKIVTGALFDATIRVARAKKGIYIYIYGYDRMTKSKLGTEIFPRTTNF